VCTCVNFRAFRSCRSKPLLGVITHDNCRDISYRVSVSTSASWAGSIRKAPASTPATTCRRYNRPIVIVIVVVITSSDVAITWLAEVYDGIDTRRQDRKPGQSLSLPRPNFVLRDIDFTPKRAFPSTSARALYSTCMKFFSGFRHVERSLPPNLSPTASFVKAFVERLSHIRLEHIPTGVSQCTNRVAQKNATLLGDRA